MQYFRITGYIPEKNLSFIMDSYGAYEKMWQFSSALIQKGCKIIAVGSTEVFLEGNIPLLVTECKKIALRSVSTGKPIEIKINNQPALQVGDKSYIPDKNIF